MKSQKTFSAVSVPKEIQEWQAKRETPVVITGYERYENIYEIFYKRDSRHYRAFVSVARENRNSDANGCG